jgi:hypothetical protein
MSQTPDQGPANEGGEGQGSDPRRRPEAADDGPPQTRDTPEGASPDRQIAEEPQQSTGLGMGQS